MMKIESTFWDIRWQHIYSIARLCKCEKQKMGQKVSPKDRFRIFKSEKMKNSYKTPKQCQSRRNNREKHKQKTPKQRMLFSSNYSPYPTCVPVYFIQCNDSNKILYLFYLYMKILFKRWL